MKSMVMTHQEIQRAEYEEELKDELKEMLEDEAIKMVKDDDGDDAFALN